MTQTITKFSHLTKFGSFHDFKWPDELPPFKRLNLIYGWNYSGKTTLSRVFHSINQGQLPADYSGASFEIEYSDQAKNKSSSIVKHDKIRVFNRSFIERNFQQEHKAPAVFVVDEKVANLKHRMSQISNRKSKIELNKRNKESEIQSAERTLNDLKTKHATTIGSILGVRNFRRPDLENRIRTIIHNPSQYVLSDEEETNRRNTLFSGDQFESVKPVFFTFPEFARIAKEIKQILVSSATNEAIQKLKNDRQLEAWVRDGLSLHFGKDECEFCGGRIDSFRISDFKRHFSEEYEQLSKRIKNEINLVQSINILYAIPDAIRFLPTFRSKIEETTQQMHSWVAQLKHIHEQWLDLLNQKAMSPEQSLDYSFDEAFLNGHKEIQANLNKIIGENEENILQIGNTKNECRQKLENHYTAKFYLDEDIAGSEQRISNSKNVVSKIAKLIAHCANQEDQCRNQIQRLSIAATKLIEILKVLLPNNNISVRDHGEGTFEFLRDKRPATNLSDGERTAIAFAYYLISLEENDNKLEEIIAVVDDPISSLDSNHIYAVYAYIQERLIHCRQLFVSTHNSEFFNIVKSKWLDIQKPKKSPFKNDVGFYWLCRELNSDGLLISRMCQLPEALKKYNSEYQFVFSLLHAFNEKSSPSHHECYTVPNLVRKFLEAYLGFKQPHIKSWEGKLSLLIQSEAERIELYKFANDASHLQSQNRLHNYPEYQALCKQMVSKVLTSLEKEDSIHYKSLVCVVSPKTEGCECE